MQEDVIKTIRVVLTNADDVCLARKTIVDFVVDQLKHDYPQASRTAIGHVVQLLYRASCFVVSSTLKFYLTLSRYVFGVKLSHG